MDAKIEKHHHHILPVKVALGVGVTLLIFTALTVWVAGVDLGAFNFLIAMAVATTKALLVTMFFMNLYYDRRENAMIFITSLIFLAIFIVLAGTDLFFRGDVYVKGPLLAPSQAKSTLKKPWISTPELVAKGKELFAVQCVSCHGVEGKGDGPAAGALNPPPRDFTSPNGWKNGRKVTMVFKTLKEGIPGSGMASFATLPSDDRWELTHYVLSLGQKPEADAAADFAKIGVDPTKEGGGEKEEVTIPIAVAMEKLAVPGGPSARTEGLPSAAGRGPIALSAGAVIYRKNCAECHGLQGEGGIPVKNMGVYPIAYVKTQPFNSQMESLRSQDAFNSWVIQGLPGDLMPGFGQLSGTELKQLFEFTRHLGAR